VHLLSLGACAVDVCTYTKEPATTHADTPPTLPW
jgi:hypothetical protein